MIFRHLNGNDDPKSPHIAILQSLGYNDVLEKNINNFYLGSTSSPHADGNIHSDTPQSLNVADGKVKLSCTKCTFTTATLKRSKAKQRLESHIKGAAHIEVPNGEVQIGGNLHSVTFQSLDIDIDDLSSSATSMLDCDGVSSIKRIYLRHFLGWRWEVEALQGGLHLPPPSQKVS